MIITPNTRARHSYPRPNYGSPAWGHAGSNENFARIDAESPDLEGMRRRIEAAEGDASWYYDRNKIAWDYWHSRWEGQTADGLKHAPREDGRVWPWPYASDTRVRTVEMLGNEHLTVLMFAALNMKVQAEAVHPLAAMKETQQASRLLNYVLFTQMSEEIYSELPLLMNWRNLFGSAILEVVWEQERRLYNQPINLINLEALAQHNGLAAKQRFDQFVDALFDPAGEKLAIAIVQSASPIVDRGLARKILGELRRQRHSEIPVPEVVKSKPRWTALRPMLDVLFPPRTDDIQRAPWVARVEYLSEPDLRDRVETAGWDEDFVDEVLEHPADQTNAEHRTSNIEHRSGDEDDNLYEVHHFYHRGLAEGELPAVYCTVLHKDCEENFGKHEPLYYDHGEYPFSAFRFEHHDRPILTAQGIAEKAYTWEFEMKKQRDMRADRTDFALKPPLLTDYGALLKMKVQWMPETIIPVHRRGEAEFAKPPQWDPGSIEIEKSLVAWMDRFFGINDINNPTFSQQRQQQLADTFLLELKPALRQTGALIDQFLPQEVADAVLGEGVWQRPSRQMIRGRLHYNATVDMRTMQPDFMNTLIDFVTKLAPLDTMGLLDRAELLTIAAEFMSYELAERLIRSPQAATDQERKDEMLKCDLILSSGMDQEFPMGANYELRREVLQQRVASYQQNPISARKIAENPQILEVFGKRLDGFNNQLQQQQNAMIGRIQTTQTFNKMAPMLA